MWVILSNRPQLQWFTDKSFSSNIQESKRKQSWVESADCMIIYNGAAKKLTSWFRRQNNVGEVQMPSRVGLLIFRHNEIIEQHRARLDPNTLSTRESRGTQIYTLFYQIQMLPATVNSVINSFDHQWISFAQ